MISQSKSKTADREISAVRMFDAPRELVFNAWTEREQIEKWWGPIGFTTTTSEMDVRAGGVWRFVMHGPDGRDYKNRIEYKEVIVPERLSYFHSGEDDTEDTNFDVTVEFSAKGNKTEVSMRMVFATREERDRVAKEFGAIEGLSQTMGRLKEYLTTL
jgi:uncharacterized protein YndB with AHSA1/START domain